jgi:threonine dehydrogenase-like Zn-dependent dehydrogenase
MAKRHEVLMSWFAEADMADNPGKVLPPNGTIVSVVVPRKPNPSFPFREVWHNGVRFIGNTAHLKIVK